MSAFPAVLALLLLPLGGVDDVRVALTAGRLDVAARAPLSEILDRIARQTGMKVVYDGPPPRQVVAADFRAMTPSRAVISLLEAQGINFAATTDVTGEQVTTLMVLGSGSGVQRPNVALAAPAAPPPPVSTGYEPTDEVVNTADELVEDEVDQFADTGDEAAGDEGLVEQEKAVPTPSQFGAFSPIPDPGAMPAEEEMEEEVE